jgi:hypothetical protein
VVTRQLHWAKALISVALIAIAAAFVAVGPAYLWAKQRDAINSAWGLMPDMNPGMAAYFAGFIIAPFIVAAMAIELGRLIAGGLTLPLVAALLFGALIGFPIGLHYLDLGPALGWLGQSAWFTLVAALFYGVRLKLRLMPPELS